MATKKKRGLSGSPAEHAHRLKTLNKELRQEVAGAARALKNGYCDAAFGRMVMAYIIKGEASAHAEESGRFVPSTATRSLGKVARDLSAKCMMKKVTKLKARRSGSTIRGRF